MAIAAPELPSYRAALAFAHDVLVAALSLPLALVLRLGPEQALAFLTQTETRAALAIFVAVSAVVFWGTGLYRGIWRYASTQDLIAIVRAVTLVIVVFLPVAFLATRLEAVPRSVLVIEWLLLVFMLAAPRAAYRVWKDRGVVHLFERGAPHKVPVLLVGAGDAADLFIRDTTRDPESPYRVVGILDEKGTRVGRNIRGVPVLASLPALADVAAHLNRRGRGPQRIILSKQLDHAQVGELLERADELGMTLARLPRLTEFKSETDGPKKLEPRPVAVEDLLQRPRANLDKAAMSRLIGGRSVLVTGAGGTIGQELARQAAEFGARRLILLDRCEYLLYQIDLELAETAASVERRPVLADVRDRPTIDRIFDAERPGLVLHAAAVKHVPLAEQNPLETILTNVLGTRNVADALAARGTGTFVQVSTDKAVSPTNVMGATKRVAEAFVQALDSSVRAPGSARFVTVRFGNVLGSSGSVVPLFQRQIERGGPVTVTDSSMTRYFMTVREAVQLVLQAGALGDGDGEARVDDVGKIYVLDMGEPVRIVDLARQMIRLAGLRPDKDVAIHITGARPGEKLHEELFHADEPVQPTRHGALRLAAPRGGQLHEVTARIDALVGAARAGDEQRALARLQAMVPEYQSDRPVAAALVDAGSGQA